MTPTRIGFATLLAALVVLASVVRADGTPCTVEANCHGMASKVTGNSTNCTCTCQTGYAGASCGSCAPGFVSYPSCLPVSIGQCTISQDCNGNAWRVTGTRPRCVCNCRFPFTGAGCGACLAGYVGYPSCATPQCSTMMTCNGRGVAGGYPYCSCACQQGYSGSACQICNVGFVATSSWPNGTAVSCVAQQCTTWYNCNGHATWAESSPYFAGMCTCGCLPGYAGISCGMCAAGYYSYPSCFADQMDGASPTNSSPVGAVMGVLAGLGCVGFVVVAVIVYRRRRVRMMAAAQQQGLPGQYAYTYGAMQPLVAQQPQMGVVLGGAPTAPRGSQPPTAPPGSQPPTAVAAPAERPTTPRSKPQV